MKRAKKAKIQKPNFSNLPIVEKKNKLDWQNFNLLENLLIFCTVPSRRVPKESGVRFHITNPEDNSACILFQIDRRHDPLIRGKDIKRPDYLSLFIKDNLLILTIIEMKGTEEKRGEGGIDQIVSLKNQLKEELRKFFPTKLKVHLQGILLTPFGSQSPDKKIIEQKKQGFVILPLQCDRSAELYNYISDPIIEHSTSLKKYVDPKISESKSLLMEELLAKRGLDQRNKDNYYSQNFFQSKDRQDIYIDYLLPNNKDWITLFTSSEQKKIQLAYSSNDEQASDEENAIPKIKKEIETLNLTNIVEIINRSLITERSS